MRRQAPFLAMIAAALAGWAASLLYLPWYRVHGAGMFAPHDRLADFGDALGSTTGWHPFALAAMVLVSLYFFARLFAVGFLLLIGGPTSTHRVAWTTARAAHLQGGIALALGMLAYGLAPEITGAFIGPDLHLAFGPLPCERLDGGLVLVASLVLAQVAIYLIALYPDLAATQGWPGRAREDRARAPRRRERPMIKPPLDAPPVAVQGDPFRAPPPSPLAAMLVRPSRAASEVPVVEDAEVPGPKLLG